MLIVLFTLGCAGVLDLSRAETLAPGEARFQAGSSLGLALVKPSPAARVAASVRSGVAPGLELGGGLGAGIGPAAAFTPDASFEAKLRLGREAGGSFHVALNPRIRGTLMGAETAVGHAELPLLLGWDIGTVQLVLAPHVGVILLGYETPTLAPEGGLTVGWITPLTEDLEIVPAGNVGWLGSEVGAAAPGGTWTVSGGLSFVVRLK